MNCNQATRLISESQDRDLQTGERTRLRLHTWTCTGCRRFKGQLAFIRQAVQGFASLNLHEGGGHDVGTEPDGFND